MSSASFFRPPASRIALSIASIPIRVKHCFGPSQALPRSGSPDETRGMETHAPMLAEKIRFLLAQELVTQAALARACGVRPQAITGWKRRAGSPSVTCRSSRT